MFLWKKDPHPEQSERQKQAFIEIVSSIYNKSTGFLLPRRAESNSVLKTTINDANNNNTACMQMCGFHCQVFILNYQSKG